MPMDCCTPFLQFGKSFSMEIRERNQIQSEIDEPKEHVIQLYTDVSNIRKKTGAGIYFNTHQSLKIQNQAISLG